MDATTLIIGLYLQLISIQRSSGAIIFVIIYSLVWVYIALCLMIFLYQIFNETKHQYMSFYQHLYDISEDLKKEQSEKFNINNNNNINNNLDDYDIIRTV